MSDHHLKPRNYQLTNAIVAVDKGPIVLPVKRRGGNATLRSMLATSSRRNAKRRPITLPGQCKSG